jgi:hypothetical protein
MIIPPRDIAEQWKKPRPSKGVFLESSHLCLSSDVMEQIGKETQNVFLAYYPEKKYILISSVENSFFTKLHEASQHLLKEKNLNGAKSLALHELLIDHEVNAADRILDYEFVPKTRMLKVMIE